MRFALRVLAVAVVAASPAWAGVEFTMVQKTEGGRGAAGNSLIKIAADGEQARVEWVEGSNPAFPKGSYMLVNAKGEMFVVNTAKKTYSKFDMTAMMEGMDAAMGGMSQMGFKMEVQNPKVDKVLEEPGGDILGYPTTHYRWHTTWTMVMHMPPPLGARSTTNDSMEDVWTTTAIELSPKAMKAFTGGRGAMTGELAKIVETAKAKMTGFHLKSVVVSGGGRGSQITTTTEVKELHKADVPASTFAIPAGYTETDLMRPQRGPAMPDLNKQ